MSESNSSHCLLSIACFPYSFYFIRLTALLQSSQIEQLIYIPVFFIASLRCLTLKKIKAWVFYLIPQKQEEAGGGGGAGGGLTS